MVAAIAIRDYRMWSRYPAPGTWTAGPFIRFYCDSGAMNYVPEILSRSPDNKVALYVIAKMMWDSDQDPDEMIEDYFQHYFQEARDPMHAYYRYLNDLVVTGIATLVDEAMPRLDRLAGRFIAYDEGTTSSISVTMCARLPDDPGTRRLGPARCPHGPVAARQTEARWGPDPRDPGLAR